MPDTDFSHIKMPPFSKEAEESVLGGMMLNNQAAHEVFATLEESDFYQRPARLIFNSIHQLYKEKAPFDAVTLSETMEAEGSLDEVGGLPYLVSLANDTPSAANIMAYSKIVKDRSGLRKLIQITNKVCDSAYHERTTPQELIERTQQMLLENFNGEVDADSNQVGSLIDEYVEELSRRQEVEGLDGLSTGIELLDKVYKGMKPGNLIVLAGRPSMGKTTLALNIADYNGMQGYVVEVFSLEMTKIELLDKSMASLTDIELSEIKEGKFKGGNFKKFSEGMQKIKESRLFVNDYPYQSLQSIRMQCQRRKIKEGRLDLVVVDYLQLIQEKGQNRTEAVGNISRGLKGLAKELDCPVIALSQLSRSVDARNDKRPLMSDLRESGSIEQDADIITFVYRDEVYYPDHSGNAGFAEIDTKKFRNGRPEKVTVECRLDRSKFMDPVAQGGYKPFTINHKKSSSDGWD